MRRALLWSLLTVVTLVLLLVLAVELRVDDVELPTPDAQQPIGLPDGTVVSLGSWLDRALAPGRAPVEPLLPAATPTMDVIRVDDADIADVDALYPGMPWGPTFRLGESHRQAGRLDQALALFQSIPETDPDFALARRRIALELLDRGETDGAVAAVKQSLASDPFSANGWQDTARVYGRALGIELE